jgi:Cu/Ag efflux pump CusA
LRAYAFAIDLPGQGHSVHDAIWDGYQPRFRPIMMTTVAALFGTLPIAPGYGEGADAASRLLASQFLTRYITSVIYLYLELVRSGSAEIAAPNRSRAKQSRRADTPAGIAQIFSEMSLR